jgi:ABC-2 type transport system ATP-binding protein
MESAIDVAGLRKRYGTRTALAGVDLRVASGEIVGLLGPNGAGKSTTLSILATLLAPDEGRVTIAGHTLPREARAVRAALGFVPQHVALYPTLSGARTSASSGACSASIVAPPPARAARALDLVGLAGRADDPVAQYSGGMRRRLNLAAGICTRRASCLLDEPTAGVDPQSRERIHVAIRRLAEDGAAVLASTHDMEEAERLCDRTVLLDDGRVVAAGTTTELVDTSGLAASLSLRTLRPPAADWLDGLASVRVLSANGTRATLAIDDPAALPVLLARGARGRRGGRGALRPSDARRRVLRVHGARARDGDHPTEGDGGTPALDGLERASQRARHGAIGPTHAPRPHRGHRQGLPAARPRPHRARLPDGRADRRDHRRRLFTREPVRRRPAR